MREQDKYDLDAEVLLPCTARCTVAAAPYSMVVSHSGDCPFLRRPAVAAALRAQGTKLDALESDKGRMQLLAERYGAKSACDVLHRELAVCKAELDDWRESHQRVIAEQCPSDEKHCTCVPALRAELARLKAQLAATRRINEQLIAGNDKLEAQLAEVTKTAQSYVWGVEVKP